MVNIKNSEYVYKPSEDTYLMLENIICGDMILEIGSGTGIIAIDQALKGHNVTAVDISNDAVDLIKENSKMNNAEIKVFVSDLFSNIKEKYDTVLFNPPYLPVENESIQWAGGKDGFEVTGRFLDEAFKYLNPHGNIYIILSDLTDINYLIEKYNNYVFNMIKSMEFDFEAIYLYELKVRR